MEIQEALTGLKKQVSVSQVSEDDLKLLTRKRYSFNWKSLVRNADLYKLTIDGEQDILGVMALVDFPEDFRIEIKLIASSKENIGKNKIYNSIAACLIAYSCALSLKKYAHLACVSLVPKTALKEHYINEYGMHDAGKQIFLEGNELIDMVKKYLI